MKRRIALATVLAAGIVGLPGGSATATPGGLDSAGGHHCWTNCASYGKYTGQYHCHEKTKKCRKAKREHRQHGH